MVERITQEEVEKEVLNFDGYSDRQRELIAERCRLMNRERELCARKHFAEEHDKPFDEVDHALLLSVQSDLQTINQELFFGPSAREARRRLNRERQLKALAQTLIIAAQQFAEFLDA